MKLLAFILCLISLSSYAKVVEYKINIDHRIANVTGKPVQAIALSKEGEEATIPAPTLEFDEGDTLRVTFNNKLKEETSIHWHGLLLPNDQDGVPYITTPPIKAGTSFTYEFELKQSGTYWYHSHTGLQEQLGVFGAIVIHPKQKKFDYDKEAVVVLSDWTNRDPSQIFRNLKTDRDWEQIQKATLRSWGADIKDGTIKKRVKSEWERMGPMDIADVAYEAFLANGRASQTLANVSPGDKVRLRIINAASSSYFYLGFGQQKMTVVSADGIDVNPVEVDEIMIAIAETYDVIVEVPRDKKIEFRATSQDVTGHSSIFLGDGELEAARDKMKPDPYGGHGGMKKEGDLVTLDYDSLESPVDTSLPADKPTIEYTVKLSGDMRRYVWTFNGKVLSESDFFVIKKGHNVRFTFVNETMMHHPIHLHGHFFRIPNIFEETSPLKHTVDVGPMGNQVIEFYANEEKDWIFHCHNLYHMEAGMAGIVRYANEKQTEGHHTGKKMDLKKMGMGSQWVSGAQVSLGSNFSSLNTQTSNSRSDFVTRTECQYQGDKECEVRAEGRRNITRFFSVYGAGNVNTTSGGNAVSGGIRYTLPLLVDTQLGVGNKGVEFSVGKNFALTRKVQLRTEYGREAGQKRYRLGVEYRKSKTLGVEGSYSNRGVGVAVTIRK